MTVITSDNDMIQLGSWDGFNQLIYVILIYFDAIMVLDNLTVHKSISTHAVLANRNNTILL